MKQGWGRLLTCRWILQIKLFKHTICYCAHTDTTLLCFIGSLYYNIMIIMHYAFPLTIWFKLWIFFSYEQGKNCDLVHEKVPLDKISSYELICGIMFSAKRVGCKWGVLCMNKNFRRHGYSDTLSVSLPTFGHSLPIEKHVNVFTVNGLWSHFPESRLTLYTV